MPHNGGVDLILGTDFVIPAGIRLDLYNSTARLPNEVEIPLVKSRSPWLTEPIYGDGVSDGRAEPLLKKLSRLAQPHEVLERAAAAAAEPASGRMEAVMKSTKLGRGTDYTSSRPSSQRPTTQFATNPLSQQSDAAEWDDGPNTGAAHQSRLGMTMLEAYSPDQASEREHPSRVNSEIQETAELSADAKEGCSVREAIDGLLSNKIEVSDVSLADDPEED
ncbi:unnamed protein product [Phytophthora fragariaefolia]|uniref:Unnamed protein product n=1 Tax=Phytophthora fragariaefolia TaxID=1490495 RepID=A0A9W6TMP9_9STRA|nr:unnamed protein product [Phytophthora fragariaefolia]